MQMNTTCPADQQIRGTDSFTDDEIRVLVAFDPARVEPCPVDFLIARVHISRLRASLARNTRPAALAGAALQVQEIFDTISHFDLDAWLDTQFRDKRVELQEQARLMGPIYAVAIRLYGILTLPPSTISFWAAAASPTVAKTYPLMAGCSMYESLRRQHRDELLRMLRECWDKARLKRWLYWPFLVLGVALAGDTHRNKQFVEQSLLVIWKTPDIFNASISALEKLRIFWMSSKTEWEECYDEPIPSAV